MRIFFFIASIGFSACSLATNIGPSGGLGGTAFDDSGSGITSIKLCGATLVDSIETTYVGGAVVKHGGNGGTCETMHFPGVGVVLPGVSSTPLQKITGCFNGNTINSLTLVRSDGATLTKGICTGVPFSYGTPGYSISGFYGRSATLLDAIGIKVDGNLNWGYFGPAGPSGSKGGSPFELNLSNLISITVCSADKVDSITVVNANYVTTKVGGNGGSCQTINLNGAPIYSIHGQYTMEGIRVLIIDTGVGSFAFGYATGPGNFGYHGGSHGLRGMIGRSGSRIDAIGAIF